MDVLFSGGYAAGQIGERPRQTHGAISPAQCELMIGQGPIDNSIAFSDVLACSHLPEACALHTHPYCLNRSLAT